MEEQRGGLEAGETVVDMPTDEHTGLGASLSNVADSVRSIVEAAEKAAQTVLEDARKQARKTVEEANRSVESMWHERSAQIEQLSQKVARQGQELTAQIEALRQQTSSLTDEIDRAIKNTRGEFHEAPAAPTHVEAIEAIESQPEMPIETPLRSRFRRDREAGDKPWTKPQ
jgi:chromosome segregation ATPase